METFKSFESPDGKIEHENGVNIKRKVSSYMDIMDDIDEIGAKIRKSCDSGSRISDNGETMDTDDGQMKSEESDNSLRHEHHINDSQQSLETSRRYSDDYSISMQSIDDNPTDNDSPIKGLPEAIRQSSRANRNSNPAAFLMKKPKLPTDMSNPAYKKPFKYGWRRELVYRANSELGPKRNGDIYYFTPDGKKVRSMREVLENLKNKELSTENFTFYKEPLGMDPELEIIRTAKVKGSATPITFALNKKKKDIVERYSAPLTTKTKSPKFGSTFKVKLSGARLSQGKKHFTPTRQEKRKSKPSIDINMLPPDWQSPSTSRKNSEKLLNNLLDKVKMTEQCSIRCKGVDPLVPTLQCSLCLCLYHPECVGMPTFNSPDFQEHYVCKNCQPGDASYKVAEHKTPELFNKVNSPSHRLNNSIESIPTNKIRQNRLLPSSRNSKPENENKNLGSVSTWVHPNSTVQINQSIESSTLPNNSEPAQSQAIIGGRKYIIIPKQNVLSIHPNELNENAQTPNRIESAPVPSTDRIPDTASLGPLTYNSEVITITTNNAQHGYGSCIGDSPRMAAEIFATRSGGMDINDSIKESPSLSPLREPIKLNSERNSTTSMHSDRIDKSKYIEREAYMKDFFMNVSIGYNVLFQIFQYLKVKDLLNASCVCRMWNDLANSRSLWRVVRMKNSQVRDWKGFVTSLKRQGTQTLDLRKMLIPSSTTSDEMWSNFSSEIGEISTLTQIDLCMCPAIVVEQLPKSNPNLKCINAVSIKCTIIDLTSYATLTNLTELRLKSQSGIELKNDFSFLLHLTKLRHLSLLSFKDVEKKNIQVLSQLVKLESLEIGECESLTEHFGLDVLSRLENIQKLRLEKGPISSISTYNIIETISKLRKLNQVELINFDVKPGFDEVLSLCTNLERFMLIPTYISQSATTNNMVLNGIFQLSQNLTQFIWGVTLELLRVTELFIDQCDQTPKKKSEKKSSTVGASIPILKPVPFAEEFNNSRDVVQDNTQVEILSLDNLETLLKIKLPKTDVKLLKIPYHATWRQSINDSIQ